MRTSDVGVVSLGCAKNRVDTERMLGLLRDAGEFRFVQDASEAEILIVNTCGFIEPAKQESIDTILELAQYKAQGKCKLLVATGCLTERYRAELTEALPELDLLLGVREYEKLPGLLKAALGEPPGEAPAPVHCGPRVLTTPAYSAYLRIGDGCSNRCAYCAIPLIRGGLQSVPMEALVEEAERLAEAGVTELSVIAQDTSGYGRDLYGKPMLLPLLTRLSKIDRLRWIRLLYTYPDTVTEELVETIAGEEKLVSYLDLPLQHIDDTMLQAMGRRGSSDHIKRVLDWIRTHAPEFVLRTTMMVGFPGETEAQFQAMLQFLRAYPFDRVGAFAFSPEEGTRAASMPGQISEEVKSERLDALLKQQAGISKARNLARIGTEVPVLVLGREGRYTIGRSYAEAPEADGVILFRAKAPHRPGEYVPVRLTAAREYDLEGEEV